jgi:hypothetical protein
MDETDPRRRRSSRTVEHYEAQMRLHLLPLLGYRPAAEITAADVRRMNGLAAKKLSPWSRSGLLSILSGALTFGVRQGVVSHNVVRDLGRVDRPGRSARASRATSAPTSLTACSCGWATRSDRWPRPAPTLVCDSRRPWAAVV